LGSVVERNLDSWTEFGPLVRDLRERYGHVRFGDEYEQKNAVLFRGQACADWSLDTTLERRLDEALTVQQYMIRASRCAAEIESVSGLTLDVPDYPDIGAEIEQKQESFHVHLPCYSYLVYLRHHGFPSPLLDWTESPYIAAYFAFDEPDDAGRVSIFVYVERANLGKSGTGGSPMITSYGPYVRTHVRHFAQKCWYTIATQYDEERRRHTFCNHSLIFDDGVENQDLLIKITLPKGERVKALAELADYNINHYTLFQTHDGLVHALASKEFDLDPVLRMRKVAMTGSVATDDATEADAVE
jgi:hypothetical protein